MDKHYIFGKYVDDKKETTMSFRVSKKTKDLFEKHANATFGGTSNALKEIFLDYMSNYAFRRQTLTSHMRIFIPRLEDEDEISDASLPIDNRSPFLSDEEFFDDLLDLNNVITPTPYIQDVKDMDLTNIMVKDEFDLLESWLRKETDYKMEDGFFVTIPLNNYLDMNIEGIYHVDNLDESHHCGINIVYYEGYTYYIMYFFHIIEDSFYPFHVDYCRLISNEMAFKCALGSDNVDLCRLIDSFNEGTSNIEDNKQLMLDKRENLQNQIREIDELLSKFD